jgi:hypothetical protein
MRRQNKVRKFKDYQDRVIEYDVVKGYMPTQPLKMRRKSKMTEGIRMCNKRMNLSKQMLS